MIRILPGQEGSPCRGSWVEGCSLLALSLEDLILQASLAKSLCWARACSNLPTLCWHGWGQLLKEGATLTYISILPILASSRKGTPHAASPPEVNAPTTPNTLPSLALTFSQVLSHIGMEVGDGEPISRLRYPSPEVAPWPAFSPLLFLSLHPCSKCLPLFSSSTWMASPALQHLQGPSLCCVQEKNLFCLNT